MSAFVKVGRKTLRALLDGINGYQFATHGWAHEEVERALSPSPKKKASRASGRREREGKREAKREETGEIRTAVLWRDGDRCVICDRTAAQTGQPLQMDHFWPRGRTPQSVETCWTLCAYDHASKTRNSPSAKWWLEKFVIHAKAHGYARQERRARDRIAALDAIEAAADLMAEAKKTAGVGR